MLTKNKIERLIKENYEFDDKFDDEEENIITKDRIKHTEPVEKFGTFKSLSGLKSKSFPTDSVLSEKTYGGKVVKRNFIESDEGGNSSQFSESDFSNEDEEDGSTSYGTDEDETELSYDNECDLSNYLSSTVNEDDESNIEKDESEIEDDISESNENKISVLSSKHSSGVLDDAKKGNAIRNQLNVYEKLLESRIKLQKSLILSNRLPNFENFNDYRTKFTEIDDSLLSQTNDSVTTLLSDLLKLQNIIRRRSNEYDAEKIEEDDINLEGTDENDTSKRRRIETFSNLLQNRFNNYTSHRNSAIQKWNDKTKISTGKLAKSNFSAFDRPTLKQIEYILNDKERLIRRTRLKRSQYTIIGENNNLNIQKQNISEDNDNCSRDLEYDSEIFDDSDFYHKLLRDYIERRTADVTDPAQLGRKWMELQKLRIKMKHKIDTRSTKGRKLRYNVHPKLVNFMVPVIDNMWNESAVTDLYNSLFGKNVN